MKYKAHTPAFFGERVIAGIASLWGAPSPRSQEARRRLRARTTSSALADDWGALGMDFQKALSDFEKEHPQEVTRAGAINT